MSNSLDIIETFKGINIRFSYPKPQCSYIMMNKIQIKLLAYISCIHKIIVFLSRFQKVFLML